MEVDITELERETERRLSLINRRTIKIQNGKLTFHYAYLPHLPNPYDSYYDRNNQEFHIIIIRNAFPGSSCYLEQSFQLPESTKKIRVDYKGKNLDDKTDEEILETFFPKIGHSEEKHKNGQDVSGYDGWLNP